MNSTRIVKAVDRLKWSTKLVLGLLLKLILLLIWGVSIWVLPWLILWCKKLYPAFDTPKVYYGVKAWFVSLKEQSHVGVLIFYSIEFFIKLCLLIYGTIIMLACIIIGPVLLAIISMICHQLLDSII